MRMKIVLSAILAACLAVPTQALAWGSEGHVLVAAIARSRLTPDTLAKVDAILAQDKDASTPSDMLSKSYWADVWRDHGHRETALWHYADIELDNPDYDAACYGHPPSMVPASAGPAQACVVERANAFADELGGPMTAPAERILALKYVLHFLGDMHQPLHMRTITTMAAIASRLPWAGRGRSIFTAIGTASWSASWAGTHARSSIA
jgi:hypothetical protein